MLIYITMLYQTVRKCYVNSGITKGGLQETTDMRYIYNCAPVKDRSVELAFYFSV